MRIDKAYLDKLYREIEQMEYQDNDLDRLFLRSLLDLMPEDIVAYGIWQTYRLGRKPSTGTYQKLNRWRFTRQADTLHWMWNGEDYHPRTIGSPKPRTRRLVDKGMTYQLPYAIASMEILRHSKVANKSHIPVTVSAKRLPRRCRATWTTR